MPNAARLTDAVDGTTAGEHSGHVPPHSPEPFTGEISGACSTNPRGSSQSRSFWAPACRRPA